jgi:hypothetical protein
MPKKPPRNRKKTTNNFQFLSHVKLPMEWQDQLQQAYTDWGVEEVKKGKTPTKTGFFIIIVGKFLESLKK